MENTECARGATQSVLGREQRCVKGRSAGDARVRSRVWAQRMEGLKREAKEIGLHFIGSEELLGFGSRGVTPSELSFRKINLAAKCCKTSLEQEGV